MSFSFLSPLFCLQFSVIAAFFLYHAFLRRREKLISLLSLLIAVLLFTCSVTSLAVDATSSEWFGFIRPGSYFTKVFTFAVPPPLRRLSEPMVWAFIVICLGGGVLSKAIIKKKYFLLSAAAAASAIGVEAAALVVNSAPQASEFLISSEWSFQLLAVLLWQSCMIFLYCGAAGREIETSDRSHRNQQAIFNVLLPTFIIIFLGAVGFSLSHRSAFKLVAHYYSWFPENWNEGFVGEHALPPVVPALGKYDSGELSVFQQHVQWAKSAGLDAFVFDIWSKRPLVRKRIIKFADELDRSGELQFALHFETLDLKERKKPSADGEDENVMIISEERTRALADACSYFAKQFMKRNSYLKWNGRPVLFLYATRHVVGDVQKALQFVREEVWRREGVDLFIVGDEVYPNVLDKADGGEVFMREYASPVWPRLQAFDAITAYNPFEVNKGGGDLSLGNEARNTRVEITTALLKTRELYEDYLGIGSSAGIPFLPTVLPGYNDRGVRLIEDHLVIPRFSSPTGGSTNTLERSWDTLVRPFLPRGGIAVLTPWNEWNEGTQIEPTAVSPFTTEDSSGRGEYTEGELLAGYGESYLRQLRELKAATD